MQSYFGIKMRGDIISLWQPKDFKIDIILRSRCARKPVGGERNLNLSALAVGASEYDQRRSALLSNQRRGDRAA